jgi:hypothetical protein
MATEYYFVCGHATPMQSPGFEGYATCDCKDCIYGFDKNEGETICPKDCGQIVLSVEQAEKKKYKGNSLEKVCSSEGKILPGVRS